MRQREVQSILELLYLGQVSIGVEYVEAFIEAATALQITGYYEEDEEDTDDGHSGRFDIFVNLQKETKNF